MGREGRERPNAAVREMRGLNGILVGCAAAIKHECGWKFEIGKLGGKCPVVTLVCVYTEHSS